MNDGWAILRTLMPFGQHIVDDVILGTSSLKIHQHEFSNEEHSEQYCGRYAGACIKVSYLVRDLGVTDLIYAIWNAAQYQ